MRLAHLSDLHVLERSPAYGLSVHWLSAGRKLDATARIRKILRAFEAAKASGADHYVVSGDLTESGTAAQFEVLAETLQRTNIAPERITLCPGNHDAYGDEGEWTRALDGPLRDFSRTSQGLVDVGELCLLPIDVTFKQPVTRSAGVMTETLGRRVRDIAHGKKSLVVVMHHPPFARSTRAWHWIDGLIGGERMMDLLASSDHVHVLHGHLHKTSTRGRIFGTTAVVEDEESARVRLYDVRAGLLESVGLA